jgi:GntR family transcriptional regulator
MAPASSSPKYQALADDLSRQIADGSLAPGSPLPSVPELARQTGMSQTNVRAAFRVLQEAGLVSTYQGRGTFVRVPRRKIRRNATERYNREKRRAALDEAERTEWVAEMDAGVGRDQIEFSVEFEQVEADPELAAQFKVVAGTQLLHRIYRTGARQEQTSLHLNHSYIPLELISTNPDLLDPAKEPWPGGTIHQLSTVGIEVAQIIDEVSARPPSPDEARALGIEPGISVLSIRKTSIDTQGRIVEIANTVLAGDRTELVYTVDLDPWT